MTLPLALFVVRRVIILWQAVIVETKFNEYYHKQGDTDKLIKKVLEQFGIMYWQPYTIVFAAFKWLGLLSRLVSHQVCIQLQQGFRLAFPVFLKQMLMPCLYCLLVLWSINQHFKNYKARGLLPFDSSSAFNPLGEYSSLPAWTHKRVAWFCRK